MIGQTPERALWFWKVAFGPTWSNYLGHQARVWAAHNDAFWAQGQCLEASKPFTDVRRSTLEGEKEGREVSSWHPWPPAGELTRVVQDQASYHSRWLAMILQMGTPTKDPIVCLARSPEPWDWKTSVKSSFQNCLSSWSLP